MIMEPFFDFPLEKQEIDLPEHSRSISILKAINASPFCKLISCNKLNNGNEAIIFEVEVELGQYPVHPIQRFERLALVIDHTDNSMPAVFALRKDFPFLPHINLNHEGHPRWLCIYEIAYEELKITWTGTAFIEDIRNWFKLSAQGKLHQEDQMLEPFLLIDEGTIIIPHDLKENDKLFIHFVSQNKDKRVNVLATRAKIQNLPLYTAVTVILTAAPQVHEAIFYTPQNFYDLNERLQKLGIDFKQKLAEKLKEIVRNDKEALERSLLIVLLVPKKRTLNSEVIQTDCYTFLTINKVKEIGITADIFSEFNNEIIENLKISPSDEKLKQIKIGLLKTQVTFNRQFARSISGAREDYIPNIFAIGLGALGSQIFMNFARSGFGRWTLIDDDIFLPHNLSRHALTDPFIGFNKAESLAAEANAILNDETFAFPINCNILTERNNAVLDNCIKITDCVLDMSASIAVSRMLANDSRFKEKRLISVFLNPAGSQCIFLSEDLRKEFKLDFLEVSYYRELLYNDKLQHHFKKVDEIRYAASCRDISNKIPNENVALFSALAAKIIPKIISSANPYAFIWDFNADESTISKVNIPLYKSTEITMGSWTIVYDDWFLEKISTLRKAKLPKETGGVLIGSFDMERKKLFLLDTLIPDNSVEYPTSFYRGIGGLKEKLDRTRNITANMITYVGEWHSHPKGASVNASHDDIKLLSWLSENMAIEGLPALMLILGDENEIGFYFGDSFPS